MLWIAIGQRKKLIFGMMFLFGGAFFYIVWSHQVWLKEKEESFTTMSWEGFNKEDKETIAAMSWKGFGPEKGLYNFTVVTAMLDIGRGNWSQQSRSYNTYLLYMQQMLKLDVNIVAFVDLKAKPFVHWMRRGREKRTRVVTTDITNLPYYKYKDRMAEIMNSAEYKTDNELVASKACESLVPEYDIVQLSKLYFINRAITENQFHNSFFMWLDGGYGHGQNIYPPNGVWRPRQLFEHADQVTFLERKPGMVAMKEKIHLLHKLSIAVMVGSFFAGGIKAMVQLYPMQQKLVHDWMVNGIVDDDQTAYMHMYYKNPSLFRLVSGDWYDVFKLFNTPA